MMLLEATPDDRRHYENEPPEALDEAGDTVHASYLPAWARA
jgi:hypothetical protein